MAGKPERPERDLRAQLREVKESVALQSPSTRLALSGKFRVPSTDNA